MDAMSTRPKRKTQLPDKLRNSNNVAEPEISTHRRQDVMQTQDARPASDNTVTSPAHQLPPLEDIHGAGSRSLPLPPDCVSPHSELLGALDRHLNTTSAASDRTTSRSNPGTEGAVTGSDGTSAAPTDGLRRCVPSPTVEEVEDEDVPQPRKGSGGPGK